MWHCFATNDHRRGKVNADRTVPECCGHFVQMPEADDASDIADDIQLAKLGNGLFYNAAAIIFATGIKNLVTRLSTIVTNGFLRRLLCPFAGLGSANLNSACVSIVREFVREPCMYAF